MQKLTGIDPWFIREIKHLVHLDEQIARYNVPEDLTPEFMTELKKNGYSDAQIAWLMRIDEELVTRHRRKLGLRRVYKRVDTCAAEFEARTNYYYSTFDDHNESEVHLGKKRIMVLGSGPNRIGQGIEFDYCCVHGVMAIRELGMEAIMINCNPETVSTDSDLADKLYFEPIFWEHLEDIIDHEKPDGIIVQLGGQTALKLSEKYTEKVFRSLVLHMIVWTLRKTVEDFQICSKRWIFHTRDMALPPMQMKL